MTALGCDTVFARTGWHCQTVQLGAGVATYVSTPIVLPGGKPLDFYLIPRGDLIEFTDDGMTLFALSAIGYPLSDKRNWKGLENLANRYGFTLSGTGAFEAIFHDAELQLWSGKAIQLLSAIAAWEEDRYSDGDTDLTLTHEVEMLLRAKAPDRKLTHNAVVKVGKIEISFDFLWGDTYVDAIRPVAQAVNARLRKALLVNRCEDAMNLLFIVDDREKKEKADDEIGVLGGITSTIRLTDFEKHYSLARH